MIGATTFQSSGSSPYPQFSYASEWHVVIQQRGATSTERPLVPMPDQLALNKAYEDFLRDMEKSRRTTPTPAPYCCPLSHVEPPFPRLFESAEWVARTKVVDDGVVLHAWVAVSRPLFSRTSIVQNDQRLEEARAGLIAAGADPSSLRDYGWEEGRAHRHGNVNATRHAICHIVTLQPSPWLQWSQRPVRKAGA